MIGESHWWGEADLPLSATYPTIPYTEENGEIFNDPMYLVCQLRCADLKDERLPKQGRLYFFAVLDYFFGDLDAECPGMGPWSDRYFRVVYAPNEEEELATHSVNDSEGNSVLPEAEPLDSPAMSYSRLMGAPIYTEVEELYPDHICLLQLDECDHLGLRFFDCGVLSFMIHPDDLKACRFDRVICYLHSC